MIYRKSVEKRVKSKEPHSPTILATFKSADSCLVADALDRHSKIGVIAGLRRLSSHGAVFGKVVTVQLDSADRSNTGESSHLGTNAIAAATPGDIIVVSNHGDVSAAAWGGMLGRAAARRGVLATIIDGACRDVDELDELQYPVFALATSPKSARGRFEQSGYQIPVEIGGVQVSPGDWVIADGSGVVFVANDSIELIHDTVVELMNAESEFKKRLDRNELAQQVLNVDYEILSHPGESR